jgi:DNA invertase Pin-like site-specific DNA recombinase
MPALPPKQTLTPRKPMSDRPGLDQMLKDASKGRFDVVMTWAIDRLGRSLVDLLATVQHLENCGVDLHRPAIH